MERFCTRCGVPLRPDATFCTACGASTGAPAAISSPKPVRKSRAGRIVAIMFAVIVALAVIGVGVGYWSYSAPPTVDAGGVTTTVLSPD